MPGTHTDDVRFRRCQHLFDRVELLQVQLGVLIGILSPGVGVGVGNGDDVDVVAARVTVHVGMGDGAAADDGGRVFGRH